MSALKFEHWTAEQFDIALSGDYTTTTRPTHEHPNHLKYYYDDYRNTLPKHVFAITGEKRQKDIDAEPRIAIHALMELKQFNQKLNPHEWSMPYISVEVGFQNKGLARQLLTQALQWMKEQDPKLELTRTANSESGLHWQHVGDTVCHQLQIPWSQDKRNPDAIMHTFENRINDFTGPLAKLVYALQCHDPFTAHELLNQYNLDLNQHTQSYIYPLQAAIQHCHKMITPLLERGASPLVNKAFIGHLFLTNERCLNTWLNTIHPDDRGCALVCAMSIRRHVLDHSHIWNTFSSVAQEKGEDLIDKTQTHAMRFTVPPKKYNESVLHEINWDEELSKLRKVPVFDASDATLTI